MLTFICLLFHIFRVLLPIESGLTDESIREKFSSLCVKAQVCKPWMLHHTAGRSPHLSVMHKHFTDLYEYLKGTETLLCYVCAVWGTVSPQDMLFQQQTSTNPTTSAPNTWMRSPRDEGVQLRPGEHAAERNSESRMTENLPLEHAERVSGSATDPRRLSSASAETSLFDNAIRNPATWIAVSVPTALNGNVLDRRNRSFAGLRRDGQRLREFYPALPVSDPGEWLLAQSSALPELANLPSSLPAQTNGMPIEKRSTSAGQLGVLEECE